LRRELAGRLLEELDLLLKPLANDGADDAETLDYQSRSRGQAEELVVATDLVELVVAPAQEGEAVQVAAVRVEEHDLEVLDSAVLLKAALVLDALAEDLEALSLAAPNRCTPADEQCSFCHVTSARD
jgi:hypothetical protein